MTAITSSTLRRIFREACEADVVAFKPGNVSLVSSGHGMSAQDFLTSAKVSAPEMARAGVTLGGRILNAVAATRNAVGCNTNLGIVLLNAPLMQACHDHSGCALHDGVRKALGSTSLADGEALYEAIRLASPGGLGRAPQHDVAAPARLNLTDAMRAASKRDMIAQQYANGFAELFDDAVPYLDAAINRCADTAHAMTALYLHLLARYPDTHIQRKHGARMSRFVMQQATEVYERWADESDRRVAEHCLSVFDAQLKNARLNPGTTADFCVAALVSHRLQKQVETNPGVSRKFPRTRRPSPAESASTVQ